MLTDNCQDFFMGYESNEAITATMPPPIRKSRASNKLTPVKIAESIRACG